MFDDLWNIAYCLRVIIVLPALFSTPSLRHRSRSIPLEYEKNIRLHLKISTLGFILGWAVSNLIIRFGTCKVRRTNQLGTALLYLGRLCRSIRQTLFDFEFVDSKIANISEMKDWLLN